MGSRFSLSGTLSVGPLVTVSMMFHTLSSPVELPPKSARLPWQKRTDFG